MKDWQPDRNAAKGAADCGNTREVKRRLDSCGYHHGNQWPRDTRQILDAGRDCHQQQAKHGKDCRCPVELWQYLEQVQKLFMEVLATDLR